MGAQTEAQIKEFISGVFSKTGVEGDNEVDKILEKANQSLNDGLFEDARDYFNGVLNLDNNNIEANAGVIKSYIAEKKTQKKINVKKIITLKEVINKPIDLLKLKFNDLSELQKIKYLKKDEGKTI